MLRLALPLAVAAAALAAPAALTQPAAPRLELPLACQPGRTCAIQQYFDHDAGPGARDHRCGPKAYDGHDGTDFRLPTRTAMLAGVPVRAAAAGTVKGVRNGVPDHLGTRADLLAAKTLECGNGVVVSHPGGWETQYCHMKQGSIRVSSGQTVAAGAPLGLVGQTGLAEFPHLHLSVRQGARKVDPFSDGAQACGQGGRSLWSPAAQASLVYRSPEVLNAGWATAVVDDMAAVETGSTGAAPTASSPALVAYIRTIGLEKGDVQTISVKGPGGFAAEQTTPALERPRAQQLLSTGKRNSAGRFPAGTYRARYTVRRGTRTALEHDWTLSF